VLLVAVVGGASLYARVWVGQRGLTVRGPLGFPAYTVPLTEIAAVDMVRVSALGEYGGWGGGSGVGSGSGRCSAVARRCR
jgi:hypothetical protein